MNAHRIILIILLLLTQGTYHPTWAEFDLVVDDVLKMEAMIPEGSWEEATVPDTLDLAERAKWSINILTHNLRPDRYYYTSGITFRPEEKSDGQFLPSLGTWDITPKNARTLSTLRVMTGSDENLEVDYGIMKALLEGIRGDGQMYYPVDCNKKGGTSYPQINALMLFAMINQHALDGNPLWLKWIDLMSKGLARVAIQVEDRAFYPAMCTIDPEGKWHMPDPDGVPPYEPGDKHGPTDEPQTDFEGYEGAARAEANRAMSALAQHYQSTGDTTSLEVAQRVLRYVLKPGMWAENSDEKRYPGYEHGIWSGHFHNGTQGLNALIDMAMITDNDWLKQFCREYYGHIQRNGIVRMGWFPAWSSMEKFGADPGLGQITEPCTMGDWIVNAAKMSDAGLGDCWDNVDYAVRNHLVEQQPCDTGRMREYLGYATGSENHKLLKKYMGGFMSGTPTRLSSERAYSPAACCNVNGAQGIYHAWHGITRFDKGVATVNLFFNRASNWMNVDSYLPYEGKVVLHNKQAHTALVRIPGWVDREKVQCWVERAGNSAKEAVTPPRYGNRLVFQDLKPKDKIILKFPVPIWTDQYTINEIKYSVTFKGSTVIDISPRETGEFYQLYQREHFKSDKAPMRKVNRFVTDRLIPLMTF